MEHDASFGHWLTRRRQGLRLQRTELAARVGCAAVTLRKIEADERRPSRQIAERLAEALAIPAHERELFVRVARGELQVERLGAAAAPAQPAPGALPRPATPLAGREREVAEARALLMRPEVRLLTLTGAPGVGKSRLALEVAAAAQGAFADGAALVELGPLGDPALVLATVAQALRVGGDGQDMGERLGRFLRRRQTLLVLDNYEHLLPSAPQLARLLAAAPGLKLLVTSRAALELSGEHRFTVLPLLAPPPADGRRPPLTAAEALARYPAVELFARRARAVAPDFALGDAIAPTVGEICRRLDGLPLAIELTAARAGLFTPAELLAQLEDRFALLTSRARDLPERHLSLRHAIGWSYSLLAPAEQRLFRRLGVFAAGCTLEAARAVCADDKTDAPALLDGIAALVASSLLRRHQGDDGRSRFAMLETIGAYAREQLEASGEGGPARARHAAHFLALAEEAERAWDRPEEWALLRRLATERANLRAALCHALDSGDAALALRLNAALFTFGATCSSLAEARAWAEASLRLPRPADAPDLAADEAKVLNVAGYVTAELGDHAAAAAAFERGLERYRALGDTRGVAWTLRGRAYVHGLRGEGAAAEALLAESLALCRGGGDPWGLAWSLYALAFLRLVQGDRARAQAELEEALAHLRAQGMTFGVVRALFALGHAHHRRGDLAGAEARYGEGLALLREVPLLTQLTAGLEGLALTLVARGEQPRAARLLGAAEALREATGAPRGRLLQGTYDQALAAAPATSGWAEAWAAGRALSPAEAVAEALADGAPAAAAGLVPLDGGGLYSLAGLA